MKAMSLRRKLAIVSSLVLVAGGICSAQDTLPRDETPYTYHTQPEWRSSESHPLRLAAYLVHPVGWLLREGIARPISYFASSTPMRRSVMGHRSAMDYREPECFSAAHNVPDCRSISPFSYDMPNRLVDSTDSATAQVYFPNVNFDFDERTLNELGRGMTKKIAASLNEEAALKVVLQGHADSKGSENYNDILGMDRAQAVKDELVRLGVSEARLSTVSFGETAPLVDEDSEEARAVNRRVEVHIAE